MNKLKRYLMYVLGRRELVVKDRCIAIIAFENGKCVNVKVDQSARTSTTTWNEYF